MRHEDPMSIILKLIVFILAIYFIIIVFGPFIGFAGAEAESNPELKQMWVICQPEDFVNIRSKPSRKSKYEGGLLCGYPVMVSNKEKNGFVYSPALNNEAGCGWISTGYLVDSPVYDKEGDIFYIHSKYRVAARKCIGRNVRCWLNDGAEVKVWFMSEEWSVTNYGFIMTQYLTKGG